MEIGGWPPGSVLGKILSCFSGYVRVRLPHLSRTGRHTDEMEGRLRRQSQSSRKRTGGRSQREEGRSGEGPNEPVRLIGGSLKAHVQNLVYQFDSFASYSVTERAQAELLRLGREAVLIACELVRHGDRDVQQHAALALGFLNPDPADVLEALTAALHSDDSFVSQSAAASLARLGSPGVPALLRGLKSDVAITRRSAASALAHLRTDKDDVIVALSAAISDDDDHVRLRATETLGILRSRAIAGIPALLRAMAREGSSWLGHITNQALAWIVAAPTDDVIEGLRSDDPGVRHAAAWTLPHALMLTKRNVERLSEASVNDPDVRVRGAAVLALERIGTNAAEALAEVMAALAQAQTNMSQSDVHTRSLLAQEKIRRATAGFTGGPPLQLQLVATVGGRKRPVKRNPGEFPKSVLALLKTCLALRTEVVSERKLSQSDILAKHRQELGLDGHVSQTSVHNHMKFLAQLCGMDSLVEVDAKRQSARFRAGAREKLHAIEPALSAYVKDQDRVEAEQAQRDKGPNQT